MSVHDVIDVVSGSTPSGGPAGPVAPSVRTVHQRGRAPGWHRLGRHALHMVLALGVVTVCALAVLPAFGAGFLVVTSGSMAPYAETGDAIMVVEVVPETIAPGDVITFRPLAGGGLVTHRVLSLHDVKGALHYRTQGDANGAPDVDLAPATGIVGRSQLVLPQVGRVLLWLRGRLGQLTVFVLPAVVILVGEIRRVVASRRSGNRGGSAGLQGVSMMATALLVVWAAGWAVTSQPAHTWARFTDTDAAVTSELSTAASF